MMSDDNLMDFINLMEMGALSPEMISERLGTVPVGVSDINAVTDLVAARECPGDAVCTICRETLNHAGADTPVRRIRRCQHAYCAECIERWLQRNKKCPMCRLAVDE